MAFAELPQYVLNRYFAIAQNQRTGGRSANPHLVLFGSHRETREIAFHYEGGEFFSIHFSENDKEIGETRIGDPHFFAVQQIVLAIGRKRRPGTAIERIGAGR